MDEKNCTTGKFLIGWHNARTVNLRENGPRFIGNTSSVFKSENDDEKHHHELFRHSGRIKSEDVEPTMKEFERSLEKDTWLKIIHSYVKL